MRLSILWLARSPPFELMDSPPRLVCLHDCPQGLGNVMSWTNLKSQLWNIGMQARRHSLICLRCLGRYWTCVAETPLVPHPSAAHAWGMVSSDIPVATQELKCLKSSKKAFEGKSLLSKSLRPSIVICLISFLSSENSCNPLVSLQYYQNISESAYPHRHPSEYTCSG
jgi:hypothetical protein